MKKAARLQIFTIMGRTVRTGRLTFFVDNNEPKKDNGVIK